MEPTETLILFIGKIALIIIFAIIPFILGIFFNIFTKFHKAFLIGGRVISILLAISIAAFFSVGIAYIPEDPLFIRPPYVYEFCFCGLTMGFLPLSTFYFTTCKKSKKRRACYLAISFIAFFFILSGCVALFNRAYGIDYQTERLEQSINEFYTDHPEADKNSDINILASFGEGVAWLTADISVYKDSITLKTVIINDDQKPDSCYHNDLPLDLVQDIIDEIIYYEPEIEYAMIGDFCSHPSLSIELADNKNAKMVKLYLPDLDGFHPNAQRLAKKINNLIEDSKIDPTKGCRND